MARESVTYHVVESEPICEAGRRLFAGDPRIHFSTSLPSDPSTVDIVHVNSALQYVEDYRDLLCRLCAYAPAYVLFSRLPAGDVERYATAQCNMSGARLAFWFLDVREVIEIMAANGYAVTFRAPSLQELDQRNFALTRRIGRASNLLFRRA
jgi:putative methyltransferase (TIGR04325 family)